MRSALNLKRFMDLNRDGSVSVHSSELTSLVKDVCPFELQNNKEDKLIELEDWYKEFYKKPIEMFGFNWGITDDSSALLEIRLRLRGHMDIYPFGIPDYYGKWVHELTTNRIKMLVARIKRERVKRQSIFTELKNEILNCKDVRCVELVSFNKQLIKPIKPKTSFVFRHNTVYNNIPASNFRDELKVIRDTPHGLSYTISKSKVEEVLLSNTQATLIDLLQHATNNFKSVTFNLCITNLMGDSVVNLNVTAKFYQGTLTMEMFDRLTKRKIVTFNYVFKHRNKVTNDNIVDIAMEAVDVMLEDKFISV